MSHPMVRSWAFNWAAEGRSPRTMEEMQWFLRRFEAEREAAGGSLLTSTRPDCEQFIAAFPTPSRRNYAWRSLRSFYGFVSGEQETPSPMAKVKAPKIPLTEVTTADEEDVLKLLRACSPFRTATAARNAAIISMLWATGLRRGELANLNVGDLDLDSMTLVVRVSKTGKSRRVPFDARAAQHLLRWLSKRENYPTQDGDALWLGNRGRLGSDGIRLVIQKLARQAGVNISCHSFRRGLTARALRAGVSGPSTNALLGWAPGSNMMARYVRGVQAELSISEYRSRLG